MKEEIKEVPHLKAISYIVSANGQVKYIGNNVMKAMAYFYTTPKATLESLGQIQQAILNNIQLQSKYLN